MQQLLDLLNIVDCTGHCWNATLSAAMVATVTMEVKKKNNEIFLDL